MIKSGLKNSIEITIKSEDTAKSIGSGDLEVFATPRMASLIEETSYKCIAPYLEDGTSSVGTSLNINHLSATPVGMSVIAECEVTEADGRKIVFEVKVYDEIGLVGEGRHERVIVYKDKFIQKTYAKLKKQ